MGNTVTATNPMGEMVTQAMESAIRNVILETMQPILLRLTEVEGTAQATRKDVADILVHLDNALLEFDKIKDSGGFIARLLKTV